MKCKVCELLIKYKKAEMLVHTLAQNLVGKGKISEDALDTVQRELAKNGLKMFRHDLQYILHVCAELRNRKIDGFKAHFKLVVRIDWELTILPVTLQRHVEFEPLVAISPVDLYEVTGTSLLFTVYTGKGALVLVDEENQEEARIRIRGEYLTSSEFSSFWPLPIGPHVSEHTTAVRTVSCVSYWGYTCVHCKINNNLADFVSIISERRVPVVWAAALSETDLDVMVKIAATDHESWLREQNGIVETLNNAGIAATPVPFEVDLVIPGADERSILVYFDGEHVKRHKVT